MPVIDYRRVWHDDVLESVKGLVNSPIFQNYEVRSQGKISSKRGDYNFGGKLRPSDIPSLLGVFTSGIEGVINGISELDRIEGFGSRALDFMQISLYVPDKELVKKGLPLNRAKEKPYHVNVKVKKDDYGYQMRIFIPSELIAEDISEFEVYEMWKKEVEKEIQQAVRLPRKSFIEEQT